MKFLTIENNTDRSQRIADWLTECKAREAPFIILIMQPDGNATLRWNSESLNPEAIKKISANREQIVEAIDRIFQHYGRESSTLIRSFLTCSMNNLNAFNAKLAAEELYNQIKKIITTKIELS